MSFLLSDLRRWEKVAARRVRTPRTLFRKSMANDGKDALSILTWNIFFQGGMSLGGGRGSPEFEARMKAVLSIIDERNADARHD